MVSMCLNRSCFNISSGDFYIIPFRVQYDTFIVSVACRPGFAEYSEIIFSKAFCKRVDPVFSTDRDGKMGDPHGKPSSGVIWFNVWSGHQFQASLVSSKINKVGGKIGFWV